jgi:membrane protein YqaA with SNARE-associated domain
MTLVALWFTTLLVCTAGAIIPFINTEIYLLSVSALSPATFVAPLVVAATLGQMIGKVAMFYAGRGVLHLRNERVRNGVQGIRSKLEHRPYVARAVLFVSATVGLPPFYVMAVACGTIGMGVFSFLLIGSVGRLIHFGLVAWLPQYARALVN